MGYMEKIKEIGIKALAKGKEVGSIAKVKLEIAKLDMDISDCKKKIGDVVYLEGIKTKNAEIDNYIEKINELKKKIEKKEKEIKEISKNE